MKSPASLRSDRVATFPGLGGRFHRNTQLGARRLIRMEFRRFVTCVIGLPCQIVTTGRRLLYRLLTVNDWTRLLIEGNLWLKHQQFG